MNEHVREEGMLLRKLRSERIVALEDILTIHGRVCLLMTDAGETLADLLSRQRPVSTDYARRRGDDLLGALVVLEEHGIQHRDIKPSNVAILGREAKKPRRLFLFDFSLSGTPPDVVMAGTQTYRDPFVTVRGRWDEAADRYSAALTLHELLTGTLPRWGTGHAAATAIADEITVDADRFDPALRDRTVRFFRKAFARDATQRCASAEAMHTDWLTCFAAPTAVFGHEEDRPVLDSERVARIGSDTSIEALPLSVRARNALDRSGIVTAGELLQLPSNQLSSIRGVGRDTAREIQKFIELYRAARPSSSRVEPPFWPDFRGPDGTLAYVPHLAAEAIAALENAGLDRLSQLACSARSRVERLLAAHPEAIDTLRSALSTEGVQRAEPPETVEEWLEALIPIPRGRGRTPFEHARYLLGLDTLDAKCLTDERSLARRLGVTRQMVHASLAKARERWLEHPYLPTLHEHVRSALSSLGCASPLAQLASALLDLIPSGLAPMLRPILIARRRSCASPPRPTRICLPSAASKPSES